MSKTFSSEPIFIQNLEEFEKRKNSFLKKQFLRFYCTKCKKEVIRKVGRVKENKYPLFCRCCSQQVILENLNSKERKEHFDRIKKTMLKKYGTNSPKKIHALKLKEKSKPKRTKIQKVYNSNPVVVQNSKELKKFENALYWNQKIQFFCNTCNIVAVKNFYLLKKQNYVLICKSCLYKKQFKNLTIEEKKNILQKRKQTCLKKYGTEYPAQSQEIQNKMKQTCLEKYGIDNAVKSFQSKEKIKQAWKNKSEEEIAARTEKRKNTCLKKYGVEFSAKNLKVREKAKQTWSQKTPEELKLIRSKASKKYVYKTEKFDSSWELAVWIWAWDHVQKLGSIKREPVSFEYEFEGQKRVYYPDFQIGNVLIEIKGPQFFKEDGTMCNPYDHSLDSLFEAKHQCGLKNGVEFWGEKEMKPIFEYIKTTYGKNYLTQFKN